MDIKLGELKSLDPTTKKYYYPFQHTNSEEAALSFLQKFLLNNYSLRSLHIII